MRIGIFGGTFDPIHIGHLRAAEDVREGFQLDRIFFMPSGEPPHRPRPAASAKHRLAMVRKAVAGHQAFEACSLEIQRRGKSYTVDTLAQLRSLRPEDEFFLILGADQFQELETWHQPERLFQYAHLIVITRPGVVMAKRTTPWGPIEELAVSCLDISSTQIRERIRTSGSILYLTPDPVRRYIRRHRLYTKK